MADWTQTLTPQEAWKPLSQRAFDVDAQRHLLRRLTYAAIPELLERCRQCEPEEVVDRLLREARPFPMPYAIQQLDNVESRKKFRQTRDPDQRREAYQQMVRENREAMPIYALDWLQFARQPENSAREKLVEFLQNVWVVNLQTVRDAQHLWNHQEILRQHIREPYPTLCQAASKSPAIIQFLNLLENRKGQPNENFARELFELFTLGEGNYTESDIQEAARAFTGYSIRGNEFFFRYRLHDTGRKTIFGKSGNFTGDDVIRLIFTQPAARAYLPNQLCQFYLHEDPLPASYLKVLGNRWAAENFSLQALLRIVCSSRIFYHPAFRANLIQSPNQFVLGRLQHLNLDVTPVLRRTLLPLRNMGQPFYNPPNVRGWVGGRNWINSTTLKARYGWVQSLFDPLKLQDLNADDYAEVMTARINGQGNFTISTQALQSWADLPDEDLIRQLLLRSFPGEPPSEVVQSCRNFLASRPDDRANQVQSLLLTLLQGPQIHLS